MGWLSGTKWITTYQLPVYQIIFLSIFYIILCLKRWYWNLPKKKKRWYWNDVVSSVWNGPSTSSSSSETWNEANSREIDRYYRIPWRTAFQFRNRSVNHPNSINPKSIIACSISIYPLPNFITLTSTKLL
jgi:hypothetical protein